MSYSQTISSHLDKVVSTFIDKIVSQHPTMSKDDLMMLWNGGGGGGGVTNKGGNGDSVIPKELSVLSKSELVELCKTKKLKHTGTPSLFLDDPPRSSFGIGPPPVYCLPLPGPLVDLFLPFLPLPLPLS